MSRFGRRQPFKPKITPFASLRRVVYGVVTPTAMVVSDTVAGTRTRFGVVTQTDLVVSDVVAGVRSTFSTVTPTALTVTQFVDGSVEDEPTPTIGDLDAMGGWVAYPPKGFPAPRRQPQHHAGGVAVVMRVSQRVRGRVLATHEDGLLGIGDSDEALLCVL